MSILVIILALAGGSPADINGDGAVDAADLEIVLSLWGHIGQVGGDLNGDRVVDFDDLLLLLSEWTG